MENSNNVNDTIREILERVVRMETKLDDIGSLRDKSNDAFTTSKQNVREIEKMQNNIQWLWRTCLGAVIGAIALYIKFN